MSQPEIYFDNAATSFPKPPSVEKALLNFHRTIGASAGRGTYPRAMEAGRLLDDTRALLAQLFNIPTPKQIIYTLNASDALNLAIKGIDWQPGDSALVSAMEHNSVLRPLHELKARKGIDVIKVKADAQGLVRAADFAAAIQPRTRMVALVHASNVSGTLQPVGEVGKICRERDLPFLVDAAQTAGAYPIDVEALHIDLLAFPGHKALLGPLGTGGLYIREGINLLTLREGGTGSRSEFDVQPDFLPDRYEPGSHNALGIAGWKAGLEFVRSVTVSKIRQLEEALTRQFLEGAKTINGLTVFGPAQASDRVAVLPVRLNDFAPEELSRRLFDDAGLMTRSGLHCAPGAHQAMGTYPVGATRFSFGYFNNRTDVSRAISALEQLCDAPVA